MNQQNLKHQWIKSEIKGKQNHKKGYFNTLYYHKMPDISHELPDITHILPDITHILPDVTNMIV